MKVLTGSLPLSKGEVRLGETARIGYYEQSGLVLTAEQENQPVLRFVQEAVDRAAMAAASSPQAISIQTKAAPQMRVESGGSMGRRKMLAGKEAAVTVQIQEPSPSGGGSGAFSEREAMSLLSRFQFPAKRWYDRVGQLSGGERRRLQLLQVLALAPNVSGCQVLLFLVLRLNSLSFSLSVCVKVLLLDEPSNDLDLATLTALEVSE